jgi:predicted DNA-binding transcriptional regulator AlpA
LTQALETGQGFIRVFEAAAVIGVTRQTLWAWVRAGKLPVPKRIFGNVVGWPAALVRGLISDRKA